MANMLQKVYIAQHMAVHCTEHREPGLGSEPCAPWTGTALTAPNTEHHRTTRTVPGTVYRTGTVGPAPALPRAPGRTTTGTAGALEGPWGPGKDSRVSPRAHGEGGGLSHASPLDAPGRVREKLEGDLERVKHHVSNPLSLEIAVSRERGPG